MKISTQISTQIVLSEEELREAVIAFVTANAEVPENPEFTVDFEDPNGDNLEAIVNIKGGIEAVGKPAKPKQTRTRKSNNAGALVTVEAAVAAAEANQEQEAVASEPESEIVQETAADDTPPFVVDEPAAGVIAAEPEPETKLPDPVKSSIFPDLKSSVASTPPAPAPAPNAAKSLFANLVKVQSGNGTH